MAGAFLHSPLQRSVLLHKLQVPPRLSPAFVVCLGSADGFFCHLPI